MQIDGPVAEPGSVLCAWPALLRKEDQFANRVAATIVQAYSIPFPAFKVCHSLNLAVKPPIKSLEDGQGGD